MEYRASQLKTPYLQSHKHRGAALIIVLSFLVLITVLIVAFLASIPAELNSAYSFDSESRTKQLADSAVNLAIGTIADATSDGTNSVWTSQPGLIRTFGSAGDTPGSQPLSVFKLYSSNILSVHGADTATFDPTNDVPVTWDTQPALFTDLNSPVVVPSATGAQTNQPVFPILDPQAATNVIGFSYQAGVDGVVSTGGVAQRLPMPVRWIYVLKDGSFSAPMNENGSVADWTGAAVIPTENNPIVGRVAYWTDDECCKVNINTAAGDEWSADPTTVPGSFWAVPHVASSYDQNLAQRQPAQYEFQRYPGHPATTYLSAVFPTATRAEIANLAPRTSGGGTLGGTTSYTATTPLPLKQARLYASVDELLYGTNTANPTRAPNVVGGAAISDSDIERARFFLTANSRAPELNLWNQPRVAIWPITYDTNGVEQTTAFDKLIAFCATIGGKAYYFDREHADSQTFDYNSFPRNQQVYNYLQGFLTNSTPGFGQKFSDKYPQDYQQILTEIFDYIRCVNLGDQSTGATRYTPGFTDATETQLLQGSGQVLPIRIGNTQGFGRFVAIQEASLMFYSYLNPNPQNSPPADSDYSTRVVLLLEMYCPMGGSVSLKENYRIRIPNLDGAFQVHPVSFSPAAANPGWQTISFPNANNDLTVNCSSGDSLYQGRDYTAQRGTKNLFIDFSGATKQARSIDTGTPYLYPFGSAPFQLGNGLYSDPDYGREYDKTFEFKCVNPITVEILPADPNNNTPIQTYTLNFPNVAADPTSGKSTWAVPADPPGYPSPAADYVDGPKSKSWFDQQIANILTTSPMTLTGDQNDEIKSIEPASGDTRMNAALQSVPAASFLPHYSYDLKGTANAFYNYTSKSLIECGGLPYWPPNPVPGTPPANVTDGGGLIYNVPALFDGVEFQSNGLFEERPDYPLRLSKANQFANDQANWPTPIGCDFDSGPGNAMDGPQINKPDEGYGPSYSNPYFPPNGAPPPPAGNTLFSPNRQIPSPVMFGSLPTGVVSGTPWTTLLFNPWPGALKNHPALAANQLPDHAILDLFWMPVVEPYAISEPFSTAGKVNLNETIVPFSYVTRQTALYAALRPIMVGAISPSMLQNYKTQNTGNIWYPLDLGQTMNAILGTGASPRIYRSASEICEVSLVPQGSTSDDSSMQSFWQAHNVTGDNLRELPYADLYSRLTTRSNTFTVHFRVQALQKVLPPNTPATDPRWAQWDENQDLISGEYRGSAIIERYIDPNDPSFSASNPINPDVNSLSGLYRYRVIGTKRFFP